MSEPEKHCRLCVYCEDKTNSITGNFTGYCYHQQAYIHSTYCSQFTSKVVPASKPALTDHAKYCRLSNQPGGLCVLRDLANDGCSYKFQYTEAIKSDWTQCPRPEKQQPVELPKDPLEELIEEFSLRGDLCEAIRRYDAINVLREFAEKVRALK